jgi:signal transduction histidine kinase/DNA-binding response OmpR family regulator/ligand-binding sensor domain-containing protein
MLSIIFTLFLSPLLQETTSPWPYQHIHKKDGLSNSAITSMYMDRYEYVWFGTWDGLNRYDGTSIKVYKPDSFKKGTISNNIVRDLLEDKQGNLWVVTHRGVNKYDRNTDTFKSYLTDLEGLPFLEYNTRARLGPDSMVWVSVIGQGVSRYDAEKDAFLPLHFQGIEESWLREVKGLESAGDIVYLLGNDGKLISTIKDRTLYSKQLVEKSALKLHHFFKMNRKHYLALSSSDGSLLMYDLANMEGLPQQLTLSGFPVSSLSANKDNTGLWAGTESGDIFRITLEEEKFTAENMGSYFPQFAKDQRKILHITETAQDLLWVGTDGDGVYKFLTRPKPFHSITAGAIEKRNISNSIVRSVYEDRDGTLYVGTRGGGLNIITPGKAQTRVLNTSNGLNNNAVLSINMDPHGNLWVGADGEGIDMVEARTKKIFHFPRDFENPTDLTFQNVYAICIDAYGTLWLGTSGYGVIQLRIVKTSKGKYRLEHYRQITYSHDQQPASINSNVVYTIVEETPNILWFGTRGAGVYRYNSLANKIEEHFHTGSEKTRLSNDDVLSLCISSKEELWIGTSGGLNKLSLGGKYQNIHYTPHEGLPNNTIHGILEDKAGRMWLSTNNGLILFDPEKPSFKTFDVNDGLQNNEFTDGASFRSGTDEKLFFGGIDGLDIIYPEKLDTVSYFPRLTITEFQIHNMIISPNDSSKVLRQHIDVARAITLDYDQNFISFHFTTLDYWNKQRTEYAYFLQNFDKDWNYTGDQSVVNLTNIPPGEYTLLINYTNENGRWNPHPKTIAITVHPPLWRTAWAYAFYTLLMISLQVGIILFIRQRAKAKRAAAINTFKIQQMKELNDYKLQFFTNIAHEFRTPLTLIMGPVTSLIKKTTSLWDKSQLKTIYNNSLRLQKLIEELIQFRKIESGKEEPHVISTDLISFAQEIVESFHQHAQEHEVHLEFVPETEVLRGWVDPRKLEKVLINLISNAIKYNIKGGDVEVKVHEQDNHVYFTIRDTGPGISVDLQEKIFEAFYHNPSVVGENGAFAKSTGIGLSLTKSLVKLHKGKIDLNSRVGKGSVFTVIIPISREAYGTTGETENFLIPPANLAEKVSQEFSQSATIHPGAVLLPASDQEGKNYSILVADDNDQIIILLKDILCDKYTVFTASNGEAALNVLDEEKIDLVISDILMPEMDGLTLCRTIKDNIQTSHIPVILLTAKAEIEDRIEGLQVGADSYIPKPFHPDHLFIRIEKLIENREQIKKRFSNLAETELEAIATGMGEKDDAFFVKITSCIQQHLSDPEFTADRMADEVTMSKASLYKKVKAITGLTPHGLIKQYRLRKAADLLRNSTMSVSEVIYETGFNSRSYFYKSFNEMFHCHPRDFERAAG